MSTPVDEPYTPEQVRSFVVPRMLLTRSLVRHMGERLRHAHEQVAEAQAATADQAHAWMAAVATTTSLIENTLKLYTTIAAQVDTRSEDERKSLQWRFMRERDPDEETTFHSRVWMFQVLDSVDDAAFTAAEIEPAEAREHLARMVERSIAYLQASEQQMRAFYRKYLPIVNAHKHGRALFALVPIVTDTGFTLQASEVALSALVSKRPGRGRPTRFITFTADEEFQSELSEALALLDVQVPRFVSFFESFAESALLYLVHIEGANPGKFPLLQFSLFADPYSAREEEVMAALRGAKLRIPEPPPEDEGQ
ncbi:MAG TPA: hypothetical protein VK648_06630 [Gemmatimonadaceae bacterium]|nr:hypothetical protein [Gemmatimonadaceae bacterium]